RRSTTSAPSRSQQAPEPVPGSGSQLAVGGLGATADEVRGRRWWLGVRKDGRVAGLGNGHDNGLAAVPATGALDLLGEVDRRPDLVVPAGHENQVCGDLLDGDPSRVASVG